MTIINKKEKSHKIKNNWEALLFLILLSIPIALGYFTNWFSLLYGLIYYILVGFIISNLFLVIPYFDRIEEGSKTNVLQAMFVSTATIALFVSVFLVATTKKENNLSIKNYLCKEYKDNAAISKEIQFSLPDQYYNIHAMQRYFLSDSTIFNKNIENGIGQDYLKLEIANNKIDRMNNFYNSIASSGEYPRFLLEEERLWEQFETLMKNFDEEIEDISNKLQSKGLYTDGEIFNNYASQKGKKYMEQFENDIKNKSVKFYFKMQWNLYGWSLKLNSELEQRIKDMECL